MSQLPLKKDNLYFMWIEITRLGESGLLLPIAALMFLWLIFFAPRMGIYWAAAFGLGVIVVVASKVAFIGWGIGIKSWNFTGFSGHTMLAASIYPVITWFCVSPTRPKVRAGLFLISMLFAALIGWSRLEVKAHSVSEVISGYLLGAAVTAAFIRLSGRSVKAMIPLWPIALAFLAFAYLGIGRIAPSHQIIVRVALAVSRHEQPFRRAQWLASEVD